MEENNTVAARILWVLILTVHLEFWILAELMIIVRIWMSPMAINYFIKTVCTKLAPSTPQDI